MREPRRSEGVKETGSHTLAKIIPARYLNDKLDMTQNLNINDSDRVTLGEVMDRLIPAVDDLPAAGQMGLGPEVERMASDVLRYANALESVLGAMSADPLSRAAGGFRALSPRTRTTLFVSSKRTYRTTSERSLRSFIWPTTRSPPSTAGSGGSAVPRNPRDSTCPVRRIDPGNSQKTRTLLA